VVGGIILAALVAAAFVSFLSARKRGGKDAAAD